MGSYIPHYTKKKSILRRRELHLSRLVERNAPPSTLLATAMEIRDARIRVLKARQAVLPPYHRYSALLAKIDRKIAEAQQLTEREILEEHGWQPRG